MLRKLFSDSRFSSARSNVSLERSIFDISYGHHLTMNAGKLYPICVVEVLPGDTFDSKASYVNRMSTPLAPVMDTAFLDQWYFYVPQRLVWEHTKEFYGENNTSAWTQQTEYYIPKLNSGSVGFKADGVCDHFGIPTLAPQLRVNALPLRAYRLIWNEWFRDQNIQDPELVNMGDTETDMTLDDLLPVNKRKDYFTTALPEPQKGPDVSIPLGTYAPVIGLEDVHSAGAATKFLSGLNPNQMGDLFLVKFSSDAQNSPATLYSDSQIEGVQTDTTGRSSTAPVNLWTDLREVTGATINALRQAFAVQNLYELDARGGSRYREFIKVHFGTTVPDLTVSVPEFLSGSSDPIVMNQVVQMSATEANSPQGGVTGMSKTVGQRRAAYIKSFSEPGYVIGVCAIRTLQSYQDGLNRMWSRSSRLDFYHPVLAHIGETPVYNKELYVYDTANREGVFGYQEAFAEYRYQQSYVSGAFRSNYPGGSLDIWTYTNDFDSLPILSDGFVRETDQNIARTLATTDLEGAPQFIVDFWFDILVYRVMPMNGTPSALGGRQ